MPGVKCSSMADIDHGECVRRALLEGPFAMRQLAADSGLSYDVLRSWRSGRRKPNRESIHKLAVGLARRSDRLRALAQELKKAGGKEPGTLLAHWSEYPPRRHLAHD
jgi:hypothetical protein